MAELIELLENPKKKKTPPKRRRRSNPKKKKKRRRRPQKISQRDAVYGLGGAMAAAWVTIDLLPRWQQAPKFIREQTGWVIAAVGFFVAAMMRGKLRRQWRFLALGMAAGGAFGGLTRYLVQRQTGAGAASTPGAAAGAAAGAAGEVTGLGHYGGAYGVLGMTNRIPYNPHGLRGSDTRYGAGWPGYYSPTDTGIAALTMTGYDYNGLGALEYGEAPIDPSLNPSLNPGGLGALERSALDWRTADQFAWAS